MRRRTAEVRESRDSRRDVERCIVTVLWFPELKMWDEEEQLREGKLGS